MFERIIEMDMYEKLTDFDIEKKELFRYLMILTAEIIQVYEISEKRNSLYFQNAKFSKDI